MIKIIRSHLLRRKKLQKNLSPNFQNVILMHLNLDFVSVLCTCTQNGISSCRQTQILLHVIFLPVVSPFSIFKRFYLFIFRGEGREKDGERNITVWLPLARPAPGNLACDPGMCPDWESNQRPLA